MSAAYPPKPNLPTTIDEVVARIDDIIDQAREDNSRIGYFAALYRKVTVRVRDGIAAGEFEDGERMERLDVIFANRYLAALARYQNDIQPTKSWLIAFQSTKKWNFLILQHLLMAINAHINLDLGIAAVETRPGESLQELENDFMAINKILSDLLDVVQDKIDALSPGFNLIDKIGGRTDEAIMRFSIQKARDEAWKFANELAALNPEEQQKKIAEKDEQIEALAKIVRNPGWFIKTILFLIRIFETSKVSKVINVLF
ncbi:hypothetical protein IH824_15950 [candidate division KSB1 bacterium]|nr:hypothetical protein [candidate division KSB1 bacterium]